MESAIKILLGLLLIMGALLYVGIQKLLILPS